MKGKHCKDCSDLSRAAIWERCTSPNAHTRPHPPYLCLSVVSLWVLLETLGIYTDGGAHPATTAAHTKHESGCIAEDDPQTLKGTESLFHVQSDRFLFSFYIWNVMFLVSLCVFYRIRYLLQTDTGEYRQK